MDKNRQWLGENDPQVQCFHQDSEGVLLFKDRLVVPKNFQLRKKNLMRLIFPDIPFTRAAIKCIKIWNSDFGRRGWSGKLPDMCLSVTFVKGLKWAIWDQPVPYSPWVYHHESGKILVWISLWLPKTSKWYDSIWVIVDRLTKSAHFLLVKTIYRAHHYTELYISRILSLHGVPRTIISDCGA